MNLRVLAWVVLASLLILAIGARFESDASINVPNDPDREPSAAISVESTRVDVERSREQVHTYSSPMGHGLASASLAAPTQLTQDPVATLKLPAIEIIRIINARLAERDQHLQRFTNRLRDVAAQSPRAQRERLIRDRMIARLDAMVTELRAGNYLFRPLLAQLDDPHSEWVVAGQTMTTGSPRYVWVRVASQAPMKDR